MAGACRTVGRRRALAIVLPPGFLRVGQIVEHHRIQFLEPLRGIGLAVDVRGGGPAEPVPGLVLTSGVQDRIGVGVVQPCRFGPGGEPARGLRRLGGLGGAGLGAGGRGPGSHGVGEVAGQGPELRARLRVQLVRGDAVRDRRRPVTSRARAGPRRTGRALTDRPGTPPALRSPGPRTRPAWRPPGPQRSTGPGPRPVWRSTGPGPRPVWWPLGPSYTSGPGPRPVRRSRGRWRSPRTGPRPARRSASPRPATCTRARPGLRWAVPARRPLRVTSSADRAVGPRLPRRGGGLRARGGARAPLPLAAGGPRGLDPRFADREMVPSPAREPSLPERPPLPPPTGRAPRRAGPEPPPARPVPVWSLPVWSLPARPLLPRFPPPDPGARPPFSGRPAEPPSQRPRPFPATPNPPARPTLRPRTPATHLPTPQGALAAR